MRKLFLVSVIFFTTLLPSCKDDGKGNSYDSMDESKASMTGRWRIVDFTSSNGQEITAEEKERMEAGSIEFTRDGSCIASSKKTDGETEKEYGTYTFNARDKTLETINDKDRKRDTFGVVFRGRDRVILTSEDGKITMERN